LDLTFYSDYLPALAGVARQYGEANGDVLGRYAAGLWENTLPLGMLWYVIGGYDIQRPLHSGTPTWSWASTIATCATLRYSKGLDVLVIEGFDVKLAGPDEFGPVESGELYVRGALVAGSWKPVMNDQGFSYVHFFTLFASKSHYMHVDYDFAAEESPHHIPAGSPLYCLRTGFIGDGCHVCLVLHPVDGQEAVFRRVGLLFKARREDVQEWFQDKSSSSKIKIV
jgi:hypothetical protein